MSCPRCQYQSKLNVTCEYCETNKRLAELQRAVDTYAAREARHPGLWDEELAAAKGKLAAFGAKHGLVI